MKEKHQGCRTNILQKFEIRLPDSPIMRTFTAEPKVCKRQIHTAGDIRLVFRPAPRRSNASVAKPLLLSSLTIALVLARDHIAPLPSFCESLLPTPRPPTINTLSYFHVIAVQQIYSVVSKDDKTIVKVWSDLGSGFSVKDPCWQSHLSSNQNGIRTGSQF